MFSKLLLPFTKPDWLSEIREGNIGASLRHKSLEIILLVKLLRLIGLKSESLIGWTTFESITKHACEKYFGIWCTKERIHNSQDIRFDNLSTGLEKFAIHSI